MAKMIKDAKEYRKAHPKDKFWKYHYELSKGLQPVPPLDYSAKKRQEHMKRLAKQPKSKSVKRNWSWKWSKKKKSKKRKKK